jgi:hypothetical protein
MDDDRWEVGARWELYGRPMTLERTSYFQATPWAHFAGLVQAVEMGEMTPANGWRFIGKEGER